VLEEVSEEVVALKNKPGCNGHEQSEVKWKTGLQLPQENDIVFLKK